MSGTTPAMRCGLVLLCALVVVYPLVPDADVRFAWYNAVGLLAVGLALWGVRHHQPARRRGWGLVLTGYLGWVVGDILSSLEVGLWELDYYPVWSDAIYLACYGALGLGLLTMVRSRRTRRDLSVVLDAAIIATGVAVVTGIFVLAPIAVDSSLTLAGKLVYSAYPVADVLMIAILVRLWTSPGSRSAAFRLLTASLAATLAGDIIWNLSAIDSGIVVTTRYNDVLWLAGYVFLAASCLSPSMCTVAERPPERGDLTNAQLRLYALAAGLVLPAAALIIDGYNGGPIRWEIVAFGSVVLSVLVLARMGDLFGVVQTQAVQLAALARSDALTGAPNRRTWDHELSRACQVSRETRQPLSVAIIDLDHFKAYNDTYGHQAGDLLLREAVAAWTELLEEGQLLARYGGEEFAVLLPGRTPKEARAKLDRLRKATPRGQSFSAGVAAWDVSSDPAEAVAAADEALYDAKRSGRNRVCATRAADERAAAPGIDIVLQPIVDLRSGDTVAMEALSRFDGEDPLAVFERAHHAGQSTALEASAIREALLRRPAGVDIAINVGLAALTSDPVLATLPADLSGVVLEITEHHDAWDDPALDSHLADLRARGARIAIDDWGRGYSNLDRLLRMRPDVLKLDMSLVHGITSDYHRATIRLVTSWAAEVGVLVCAEGVETPLQRDELMALGVHLGQGELFGSPANVSAELVTS